MLNSLRGGILGHLYSSPHKLISINGKLENKGAKKFRHYFSIQINPFNWEKSDLK